MRHLEEGDRDHSIQPTIRNNQKVKIDLKK
jgi:hypothetical protein